MPRLLALVALLACTAAPAAAEESPVLHVRARLRVDVDAVERVTGGLEVRGSLRDDANDDVVVGRTVAISVEGPNGFWHYAEPTGPDGHFTWRVPLPLGAYNLRIAAGGDPDYVAAAPVVRPIDVARRTPTLDVRLPARVPSAQHEVHLVVLGEEADGDGPPRALEDDVQATVRLGRRRPQRLVFHAGRAELDLAGPFRGAGERLSVTVRVEGDELRNPADATRSFLVTAETTLSLSVPDPTVARGGRLAVDGRLSDDRGPLAGADVAIGLDNGPDLAHARTDRDGRFQTSLRGRDLPLGTAFLEARYLPNRAVDDWHEASASPTVPVTVTPAPPITLWPYLLSPALTLLAGAIVAAARTRRWRLWLARRKADGARAAAPPPVSGLTESRPRLLSTLRGRADHGLTGVIVDAVDDRPIATATVAARSAAGEGRSIEVDENGRFALEGLPAGPIVVAIDAPGYVGEIFTRSLPHRGELRGARVRLVPVRARIFEAWRRAAGPLYPTPRAADTMTPRELLRFVDGRSLLPNEPLGQLTALVETAVWAAHAPSRDELDEAEKLVQQIRES